MSDDAKISDRPYPFDVKTALFQLFGIAIGTPKNVADINIEVKPAWDLVEVSVYVGGYDGQKNQTAQFHDSFYMDQCATPAAVKRLQEMIEKINVAIADGRKIKAKRLRDQAEELLKRAQEVESGCVPVGAQS